MEAGADLFARLMPARTASTTGPRSFGREDYLTEVVGAVLQADCDAGGGLCSYVLRDLFGIELHGSPVVRTQVAYPSREAGESRVDLAIRTARDVVFLENKTGAALGRRRDGSSGADIDQLTKYQRELDHQKVVLENRHLAMLVWSPQPNPPDPRYWRGHRTWWDLYDAVGRAPLSGDAYADRLRSELLAFFRHVELDPPPALRAHNVTDVAVVQRILALALDRVGDAPNGPVLLEARPASWGAYLFQMEPGGATWSFGFSGGSLVAHVSREGYRGVQLPESFFEQDRDEQVDHIAAVLRVLPTAPPDLTRRGGLSEEEFLAAFGDARPHVEAMLRAAQEAGWALRIGSTEAVLERHSGLRICLSAAYAGGPKVRVWSDAGSLCDAIRRVLIPSVVSEATAVGESVHFLIASADPATIANIPRLLGTLEQARP